MTRARFHGLKKVKVRATWNKYNLYNLWRSREPYMTTKTYYQQKWIAKSTTRAYHGEHIKEKQWQRMFSPKSTAVVTVDPKHLAYHDGSENAAGRGSGRDTPLRVGGSYTTTSRKYIPFMSMTYAPMERRLDMAVWRALFASSARQARQFVIHGMVKVNGQKMPYAGYLLNPGDMFQVDVERVLYATGAPKTTDQIRSGRKLHRAQRRTNVAVAAPKKQRVAATPAAGTQHIATKQVDIEEVRKQRKLDLKQLLVQADGILTDKKRRVGAKRKIAIRSFVKDVKKAIMTLNRKDEKELNKELTSLISQLSAVKASPEDAADKEAAELKSAKLSAEEEQRLREAVTRARQNPVDDSKPYATPWTPRPYMSAFAFIPRYLEVNHNICSAVYLRHPVVKQGQSEVPSPFGDELQQLAFNWYLRGGR